MKDDGPVLQIKNVIAPVLLVMPCKIVVRFRTIGRVRLATDGRSPAFRSGRP